MLKHLRRRVILVTMAAVVLVFALLLGMVNIMSHISNEQEADTLLATLADNGGAFKTEIVDQQETVETVPAADSSEEAASTEEADSTAEATEDDSAPAETSGEPETRKIDDDLQQLQDSEESPDLSDVPKKSSSGKHGWKGFWSRTSDDTEDEPDDTGNAATDSEPTATPTPMKEVHYIFQQVETAETPYETRYFSVQFTDSNNLSSVDTSKIAAVTTEQAASMAEELLAEGSSSGYYGDYKYLAASQAGGTLYVFLDCTRNRQSERELLTISLLVSLAGILVIFLLMLPLSKKIIRPVKESYEKQKQFITNAGHEIKTPLAVIDSCTEVLELENDDEENRWIQGIRSETSRLTTLTSRMTALARMDEGSQKPDMAELNLSRTASDLAEDFSLLAEQKGLKLEVEIAENLTLKGNAPMLEELCAILLDNAVKYCVPEGTIHFTLEKKGRHIILQCENPAENLSQGKQTRAFDRFYRGDTSHSSSVSGYGIGLSMAQSIVDAHHGKISAESPDGTRFVLTVTL